MTFRINLRLLFLSYLYFICSILPLYAEYNFNVEEYFSGSACLGDIFLEVIGNAGPYIVELSLDGQTIEMEEIDPIADVYSKKKNLKKYG